MSKIGGYLCSLGFSPGENEKTPLPFKSLFPILLSSSGPLGVQ
jgi:hypothetical protein